MEVIDNQIFSIFVWGVLPHTKIPIYSISTHYNFTHPARRPDGTGDGVRRFDSGFRRLARRPDGTGNDCE